MTDTTITKSIILKAAPEVVWEYLTDHQKLGEWFHPAKQNLAQGETFECVETKPDGSKEKVIWGEVFEMQAPVKLVYTFTIKPLAGAMTTVTWQLNPVHGGTQLCLSHEGIDQAAGEAAMGLLMALDAGWAKHIMKLREVLTENDG